MHATTAAPTARPTTRTTVRPNPRPNPRPVPRGATARPVPAAARPAGTVPATAARRSVRGRAAVAVAVVGVALGAVAIGVGIGHAGAELEGPAPARPVYVVQPGDTLWAIAGRVAPGVDTARAVAALRDAAGGATLTPGQRIVVPRGLS